MTHCEDCRQMWSQGILEALTHIKIIPIAIYRSSEVAGVSKDKAAQELNQK